MPAHEGFEKIDVLPADPETTVGPVNSQLEDYVKKALLAEFERLQLPQ